VALQHLNLQQNKINNAIVRQRLIISALFMLLLLVILVSRQYFLQVVQYHYHATLAQNNRIALRAVTPIRGLIFDRGGTVLAQNRPSFFLTLTKEGNKNWAQTIIDVITLLELDLEQKEEFRQKVQNAKRFEAVPLIFDLSEEQIAKIAVNQHNLPGVAIDVRLVRHYPKPHLFAHAIGYVGRINEQEATELDRKKYAATNFIGKTAVEKFYQEELHGFPGFEEVEVNSRGRVIRVLRRDEPTAGKNIKLSLDANLQQITTDALNGRKGAAIAIDVNNGEVLALVSTPSFDPNPFVLGISNKAYQELVNDAAKPLFNRALRGVYPPGSTIKPLTALAGLDSGVITAQSKVVDKGFYQLKGSSHQYRNWNRSGDGPVALRLALARSNDTYFYDLAHKLGIDRMHAYLSKFGIGSKISKDMFEEASGVMPSSKWKKEKMQMPWFPGETLIAGIGQGYMLTTPLQLAHATALLANKGKWFTPHLAKKVGSKNVATRSVFKDVKTSAPIWHEVQFGMREVVHGARGTARKIGLNSPYEIAGKSGTAQVVAIKQGETYKRSATPEHLRDHALFIAFAPFDEPKIAVAVIIENGESGSGTAAPIAKQIMDGYLLDAKGKLKK